MSEDMIKKIFSKNLCNYLSIMGKSQADLCKHMGVSSATVSDWCNGKKLPRMDKIQSICNWMRIEKSDLLEEKEKSILEIQNAVDISAEAKEVALTYDQAPEDVKQMIRTLLKYSKPAP